MTFAPLAMTPTPLSRTGHVVESLRGSILRGDLAAGQPLIESELAAAFGMSKTPVREALKALSGLGLVTMSEYRGAVVRSVDADMAGQVFGVRLLLEPQAVAMSVRAGIDADAAADALRRASEATDAAERSRANRDFHRITFSSCGNPLLISILDGLRDQTSLITVTAWRAGGTWRSEADEHQEILAAIEAGDAERAQELDHAHISSFAEQAIEKLGSIDD